MAKYETLSNADKLKGSCEWTKVYFDEDLINEGKKLIVTDTQNIQYVLEKCLGHGFEGEVWKVRRIDNDQNPWGPELALKFEIGDVEIGKHLKSEYDLLTALDHPYIVKPVKYWLSPILGPEDEGLPRGHMLTIFIKGPHLDQAQLDPHEAKIILLDLIKTIRYLNVTVKIYHGDLKGDNILITQVESFRYPILIDFGFPGPIENQPYIDRKSLGLIYLLLIGWNDEQIAQFKKNIDWFKNFSRIIEHEKIKQIAEDIVPIRSDQLKILQAFFDGTDYDDLYSLVNSNFKCQ